MKSTDEEKVGRKGEEEGEGKDGRRETGKAREKNGGWRRREKRINDRGEI